MVTILWCLELICACSNNVCVCVLCVCVCWCASVHVCARECRTYIKIMTTIVFDLATQKEASTRPSCVFGSHRASFVSDTVTGKWICLSLSDILNSCSLWDLNKSNNIIIKVQNMRVDAPGAQMWSSLFAAVRVAKILKLIKPHLSKTWYKLIYGWRGWLLRMI